MAISHKVDFKANKPKIQRCYITTKGSIYPGRQSNPKYVHTKQKSLKIYKAKMRAERKIRQVQNYNWVYQNSPLNNRSN